MLILVTTPHHEEEASMNTLKRFFREDDGQDMVEYALLASFISIVAIIAIRAIGPLVNTIYENIQAALT
jgi:Flp pilus assembly pilin Flp